VIARADAQAPLPLERIALAIVAALLVLDSVWVLLAFGIRFTDEDQTIYWFAAEEFSRLRIREPFFYGQRYNTLLEAVPAAVLRLAGVPPWASVPGTALAFGLAPWAIFAALAWRRGARLLAVALLAAPLLLPMRYSMLLCLASYNAGVLLAALGIAAALSVTKPGPRWFASGLLLGLAAVQNPNSIVLAAPAAIYFAIEGRSDLALRRWASLGLALAAAAQAAGLLFYKLHPAYDLHVPWPLELSLGSFRLALGHLDRFFGTYVPAWLPRPELVFLGLAAAVILAVRARRASMVAAAACAAVGLLLSLAVTKLQDGTDSIFYSYARMYLALPALFAFLAVILSRPGRARSSLRAAGAAAIVVLAAASTAVRAASFESAAMAEAQRPALWVQAQPTQHLRETCSALEELAERHAAPLVIHLADRPAAYGCGALLYGRVETLFPRYERRTWLLLQEQRARRGRVLFSEVTAGFCPGAAGLVKSCRIVSRAPDVALVELSPPATPLRFVRERFRVRAFE